VWVQGGEVMVGYVLLYVTFPLLLGAVVTFFTYLFFARDERMITMVMGSGMLLLLVVEYIPHIVKEFHFLGVFIGCVTAVTGFLTFEHILKNQVTSKMGNFPFIVLLAGFIFHSVPTGISIGVLSKIDFHFAQTQLKGIFLHHLAEGGAMMAILSKGMRRAWVKFIFSLFIMTFCFYGSVYIGTIYEYVNLHMTGWIVGVALGTLLYAIYHLFIK
jgi:zinc transporter, ZIP family